MSMIRPGGEKLTEKAVRIADLPPGAAVLDVGCGEGDTAAFLAEEYGYKTTGVDLSVKLIDKGKARHPGLDLRQMEAEFLSFESFAFDAVLMECSLSVLRLQADALFEAYCVLKPGGALLITDLYIKDPDPARVAEVFAAAREKAQQPVVEGACGENAALSTIMLDGAILVDELAASLEELGFEIVHFSDESDVLPGFAAQAILGHGSLEAYFRAVVPEGEDPARYCACGAFCGGGTGGCPKNLGYFLMIAKKREA
ncbi:MAG: methyltransferase domain-containing protein [Clostridiales Family XIII bacterium]|jgi:ubiquinone/menaquinone biosynthesis C-methylase UbiE|nr:methyltransferase domain-containing protein [Clostridiales Family XIII bacterium]